MSGGAINLISISLFMSDKQRGRPRLSRPQTPPSHEEKGQVSIERFFDFAESAILIFK